MRVGNSNNSLLITDPNLPNSRAQVCNFNMNWKVAPISGTMQCAGDATEYGATFAWDTVAKVLKIGVNYQPWSTYKTYPDPYGDDNAKILSYYYPCVLSSALRVASPLLASLMSALIAVLFLVLLF
eukprot:TRINITY_DN11314_c0_g1_i3.p1 TRINITY_DN11314_c0_g1~~TRINITY_DN11314_c0_g1_i3.p1  ORF type:complete len:126 (+),score=18.36 TRINITY_DN11314_c0_g1_i3:39-416(+)